MASKKATAPAVDTLLVELLTEELPPRALQGLAERFRDALASGLDTLFPHPRAGALRCFATPRRLAVSFGGVHEKAVDVHTKTAGPPVSAGPDAAGGFARKCGVPVESLTKEPSARGEVWLAHYTVTGARLDDVLAERVDAALKALPIPKLMRWGNGDARFARPVHGLMMLHGKRVVPGTVLGMSATNTTSGHRFMGADSIRLSNANEYEARLRKDGRVLADFAIRKAVIDEQLKAEAKRLKATLGEYQALLEEVTALVEFPAVYAGAFDASFLDVPQECLILTMRQNQKYFPLFTPDGKLLSKFLIVSNMRVNDPRHIVGGNERVVRPRFEDARFFFNQDRKIRLEARVPQLAKVMYHNKLGSQLERIQRIKALAGEIARALDADVMLAERAAELSKADLLTGMVGEFPELQGIMGRYYALHDGEPSAVADAIGDQYKLHRDDADPENLVSVSLYLADRIEQTVGLFGVGERPTGEKDPFALRRAALGIIKVFSLLSATGQLTGRTAIDLKELLERAAGLFATRGLAADTVNAVYDFIIERYRNYLVPFFSKDSIESVLSQQPPIGEVEPRIQAVEAFRKLPEAESLAAANKRIRNILRKSESASASFDISLLFEAPEKVLHESLQEVSPRVSSSMETRDYARAMQVMAALKGPVDIFFDKVLVNTEDVRLRNNRHALLRELDKLMNRVADISKLAA